jgi:hypothetical protein
MGSVYRHQNGTVYHYTVKVGGRWREHSGYADKDATRTKMVDHQRRIDRGEVGLVDPFTAGKQKALAELVTTYIERPDAAGQNPRHLIGERERLLLAFAEMQVATFDSIVGPNGNDTVPKVEQFLNKLRLGEVRPGRPTHEGGKPKPRPPASAATVRGYVVSMKAFGRYLHRRGTWPSNPFELLQAKKLTAADRTRSNRALTPEEIDLLVQGRRGAAGPGVAQDASERDGRTSRSSAYRRRRSRPDVLDARLHRPPGRRAFAADVGRTEPGRGERGCRDRGAEAEGPGRRGSGAAPATGRDAAPAPPGMQRGRRPRRQGASAQPGPRVPRLQLAVALVEARRRVGGHRPVRCPRSVHDGPRHPQRVRHDLAPQLDRPGAADAVMRHKTADLTFGTYDKVETDELRRELERLPVANALRAAAGAP